MGPVYASFRGLLIYICILSVAMETLFLSSLVCSIFSDTLSARQQAHENIRLL